MRGVRYHVAYSLDNFKTQLAVGSGETKGAFKIVVGVAGAVGGGLLVYFFSVSSSSPEAGRSHLQMQQKK